MNTHPQVPTILKGQGPSQLPGTVSSQNFRANKEPTQMGVFAKVRAMPC